MKLGTHKPLLILKVLLKSKTKPTKETRYTGCHSSAIMGTRKKYHFFKHGLEEINLIADGLLNVKKERKCQAIIRHHEIVSENFKTVCSSGRKL